MKLLAIALLLASTAVDAAHYPALGGKVLVDPDEIISVEHDGYMLRVDNVFFTDDGRVALWVGDKMVFSNGEICDFETVQCIDVKGFQEPKNGEIAEPETAEPVIWIK